MTRIVVGVDGSDHSRRALLRALEEAQLRGGVVDAVLVYEPPHRSWSDDLIGLPSGPSAGVVGTISPEAPSHDPPDRGREAQVRAEQRLEQFVDRIVEGLEGPAPNLVAIAADHPAAALIEESLKADLLVIGTRGLGGFAGMLLGSVAHQCIQRSHCPVLILPPEAE